MVHEPVRTAEEADADDEDTGEPTTVSNLCSAGKELFCDVQDGCKQ